jgi:hypothetical protein
MDDHPWGFERSHHDEPIDGEDAKHVRDHLQEYLFHNVKEYKNVFSVSMLLSVYYFLVLCSVFTPLQPAFQQS